MKSNTKIKNVAGYASALFAEFVAQQSPSIVEEAQESVSSDTGWSAEVLEYPCVVRGLSEVLLQGEHRLSQYAEFQRWLREIGRNPNDEEASKVYNNYNQIMDWVRAQFSEETEALDRALRPSNDEQEMDIWGDTLNHKVENYLTHYAEKMSPKQLYMAKDRIFALRKEAQEGRDGLNYKSYVKAMLLVLEQIVKRCNSNRGLLDKFQEMQFDLESVNCSEDVRLESTACMSLDIEAAIDLKRKAECIADRHNLSIEEAMFMLQEANE